MNRVIHRGWGDNFWALTYKTQEAKNAVDKPVFYLSTGFL